MDGDFFGVQTNKDITEKYLSALSMNNLEEDTAGKRYEISGEQITQLINLIRVTPAAYANPQINKLLRLKEITDCDCDYWETEG